MPHNHRFYISPDAATDETDKINLPSEEAHHALHVLRLQDGEPATVFDGRGREWQGTAKRAGKRGVTVMVESSSAAPPPQPALTLAQAWLHREKTIEFIVRHGTEIGISNFVFFRAAHSERKPSFNPKWERIAIECCKQCGRNWLPGFNMADSLATLLAAPHGDLLFAAMHTQPQPLSAAVSGADVTYLVGPEGDFSEEETGWLMESGARPISLGTTIYRSEMAAVIGGTLIRYHLGGMGNAPNSGPEL